MISFPGLAVLALYLFGTLLIGVAMRPPSFGVDRYLNATRSLPVWAVTLSFLSANCGALEIVGLTAMAAQYGVQAFHFYWIGAIPAMVFLSLWMLPVYLQSGVHSLPEFLERRFDSRVRLLNTVVLLLSMVMLSGVSLYAMAQVLLVVLGWSFAKGAVLATLTVLVYVLLGGIRATIYNEIFQLVFIVAGLLPLTFHLVRSVLQERMPLLPRASHLWKGLPGFAHHAPMDGFGVCFGLGFVLSFSYWCTDFVLMQRALATRDAHTAPFVPLLAGFGKIAFSGLVVLPGLASAGLLARDHIQRYDQVLPQLMVRLYSPTVLGLGVTAVLASLMSGLAANISAISALLTTDLYRPHLRRHQSDQHYFRFGQFATLLAALASIVASLMTFRFASLMEYVQLIFSLFSAPFFALLLLGLLSRSLDARGALLGLSGGIAAGFVHQVFVWTHLLHYGSAMSANFYVASLSFTVTLVLALLLSRREIPATQRDDLPLLRLRLGPMLRQNPHRRLLWASALILLATVVLCNFLVY